MVDIDTMFKALTLAWIPRLLILGNQSWKTVPDYYVWQIFVKKFRHFFRIKYPLSGSVSYAVDGKLAFNLVNKLNRSVK